jgi:hypothetical protein
LTVAPPGTTGEAFARAARGEMLAASGDAAAARVELDAAAKVAASMTDHGLARHVAIRVARVRGERGTHEDRAAALRDLEAIRAKAALAGTVSSELFARLAIGVLERRDGRAEARAHLEAVEKDASAKGFGLVARNAARALGR